MCSVHTKILTKTKPWTTVHPSFEGDIYDALSISKVGLVYLDMNRFARLWKKVSVEDRNYITQSYDHPMMVTLPPLPLREELETSQTLLECNKPTNTVFR